jgi:hypothetical protein
MKTKKSPYGLFYAHELKHADKIPTS